MDRVACGDHPAGSVDQDTKGIGERELWEFLPRVFRLHLDNVYADPGYSLCVLSIGAAAGSIEAPLATMNQSAIEAAL